ncbi:MAG: HAMP domain-containing protein [Brevinematales bacterium]|nr:HAMP domain-containing protein [Brevinematales bacterium]
MKIRGKIRYKILLVVIPILILTAAFLGVTSYFSAKNGITGIAKEFLGFKLQDIYKYAAQQNNFVKNMDLTSDPTIFINTKKSVGDYASTVINSPTGGFVGVTMSNLLEVNTVSNFNAEDATNLVAKFEGKTSGWVEFDSRGKQWVGVFIDFSDWNLVFTILEARNTFYKNVNEIVDFLVIILSASLVISTILLLFFIARITTPINRFVNTIQDITSNMDLTKRVKIFYPDEIGVLGFYFNNMIAELEGAYNQIKNYAYQTVLAKKREERIRFIFQKFVPQEVINQVLNLASDSMLIGARQKVSVFFSDIRGFTTISESLKPEELVLSLNSYFDKMVRIIISRHGTVDKFIGDAIMAIFGAPLVRPDDAESAVYSAIQNTDALEEFNKGQRATGKIEFHIGVGINTGDVIVGNIGSEQKIDYTVIGDTVNLASRLEGLTKMYHVPIVISEFTKDEIPAGKFYFRELDTVRVKGKNKPVKIYCPYMPEAANPKMEYYKKFHETLNLYYDGKFSDAKTNFVRLSQERPEDEICQLYIERCEYLIKNPPKEWEGVETMHTK